MRTIEVPVDPVTRTADVGVAACVPCGGVAETTMRVEVRHVPRGVQLTCGVGALAALLLLAGGLITNLSPVIVQSPSAALLLGVLALWRGSVRRVSLAFAACRRCQEVALRAARVARSLRLGALLLVPLAFGLPVALGRLGLSRPTLGALIPAAGLALAGLVAFGAARAGRRAHPEVRAITDTSATVVLVESEPAAAPRAT